MAHVVVIGAGQAGASLVAKLRGEGFKGDITLVGEEPYLPYQRPPLSKKYLLGEMEQSRLLLRPESFYEENDITLKLGEAVTSIDADARSLEVGPETLVYDELVFTTGSRPRLLPDAVGGNLDGVYTVRDLADIDTMAPEFQRDRHVLIVGGGYIGLEAAAVAASKGLRVTLVEMSERILQRVACQETSDYFRDLHEKQGVKILEGVGLDALAGETRVTGAALTNGHVINVDFVIVGIGILPNSELAEAAGCKLENGIRTDAHGRTSVQHIWAAGDCASFPYKGERLRLESVPNAIDQAEIVAQNIAGEDVEYLATPWFWSDQFDIKLQIAGLNAGHDDVITRKVDDATSFWYYKADSLLAVDAMNDPRGYMIAKRLIEAGKSPQKDTIANPETDLMALMKSML